MHKTVSIIIPTHNRRDALRRLLDKIADQTYPSTLIEVVVVADGCVDYTSEMLKNYRAEYALKYIEQEGLGASFARNNGAQLASGEILLFLDDDIDPSPGLVEHHINGHIEFNSVVIGYLIMPLKKKPGLHLINLANFWNKKYLRMQDPGYRFGYDDLLSGNFSINGDFYKNENQFDTTFQCREDYELGARLIKAGARFSFSLHAWGYHLDESTAISRSFKRKRMEGKADIQLIKKYPELFESARLYPFAVSQSRYRKIILFVIYNLPALGDSFVSLLQYWLHFLGVIKFRLSWDNLNVRIHEYWYARGITDVFTKQNDFNNFVKDILAIKQRENGLSKIDLALGLGACEQLLDDEQPDGCVVNHGQYVLGTIIPEPGREKLIGRHLRATLAKDLPEELIRVLMIDKSSRNKVVDVLTQ